MEELSYVSSCVIFALDSHSANSFPNNHECVAVVEVCQAVKKCGQHGAGFK